MAEDDDNVCSGESGKKFRNGAKVLAGGVIIIIVIVALLIGNNKIQENKNKNGKNNSTSSDHHKSGHHNHHRNSHHGNKTMGSNDKNSTTLASSSKIETHHPPPSSAPDYHDSEINSTEICTSEACKNLGNFLVQSLNTKVSPCDDFYAFACGGWEQQQGPIPDDVAVIDEWAKLQKNKVVPQMSALFEGPLYDLKVMAGSVVMAQQMYKDCVDQKTRDEKGWEPFLDKLSYLLGFHWPGKNGTDFPGHTFEELIARFAVVDVKPVANFEPVVDKWNAKKRIIEFFPPTFGLSRAQFANKTGKHADQYQAYRKFLKTAFQLVADASNVTHKLSDSALDKRVDAVLDLETKLALSTLPEAEAKQDLLNSWSNRMRFKDFQHLTTVDNRKSNFKIDWAEVVQVYGRQLQLPLTVAQKDDIQWMIVSDVNYFKNMTSVFSETEPPLLADYFALQFLYRYRAYGPSKLVEADFKLKKVTDGLQSPVPARETCLEIVQEKFPLPSARLYVDHHVDSRTVTLATKVADLIKDRFKKAMEHAKEHWLDSESIQRGKRKLEKSRFVIGYPRFLTDNAALDRAFGLQSGLKTSYTKGQFLKTLFNVTTFTRAIAMKELWGRQMNDTELFELSPMQVNAFAIRDSNVTFIPIAFLQPPFFDPNLPAYLQLAGIGETLAHELVHLFDDQNLKRKPNGKRADEQWWTDHADGDLKKRANCFVYQYGNLTDSDTGLKVNGQLTLRENIADNGGIRTAWYAFEELQEMAEKAGKKLMRLPHLTQFTPAETFFIAHAKTYCSKVRPELARTSALTSLHAPSKHRLNIPLANLRNFYQAFKCKEGSAMRLSSDKRCRIW